MTDGRRDDHGENRATDRDQRHSAINRESEFNLRQTYNQRTKTGEEKPFDM